jgi:cytochrome c-type biogenesis protein
MIALGPAGLAAAFAAGFISFLSPCVLPLIPGYLSFVSGVGFDELGSRPGLVVSRTALFVLGFGAMFALLGAGVAWFGDALLAQRRALEIVAGVFIALMGAVYAGVPLPALLLRERRLHLRSGRRGPGPALLAGVAFAVGWTPCIGPTLAAILALASAQRHAAQGAILLLIYSLGLGVPFLLFGLVFTRALGVTRALRRHWRAISLVSGGLLMTFGVLLAAGELTRLTASLSHYAGVVA